MKITEVMISIDEKQNTLKFVCPENGAEFIKVPSEEIPEDLIKNVLDFCISWIPKEVTEVEKEKYKREFLLHVIVKRSKDRQLLEMKDMFSEYDPEREYYNRDLVPFVYFKGDLYRVISSEKFKGISPANSRMRFRLVDGSYDDLTHFDEHVEYNYNDRIVEDGYIWCCIGEKVRKSPTEDPDNWEREEEFIV